MNDEERSAVLRRIAQTYVWWKEPEKTLQSINFFLSHALDLATWEDAMFLVDWFGRERILESLNNAPPGVLRPQSWSFWHLWFGVQVPPLPRRILQ